MQNEHQIFGIRAVIEAVQAGKEIDKVFIQKEAQGELMRELLKTLKKNNINFSYVPVEKLNKLSKFNNHQGAVASITPIKFVTMEELVEDVLEKKEHPLFLILDQLSDARNFGAIIRTAECTGVDGIIIQKQGSAPVNGDTVKTSAGAVFNIPICKVDHIKDAVFYLQGSGITTVAATEKTENNIYNIDFTKGIAIIMGSEDKGVNPSVLKIVDEKAKLPMFGTISSLNVSVA
ncbi:MAG TPA: 23S rRNA (guanosine(2251)-2'-O)-methyltransferase RlmB, partial [Flavobacterium sp.]|nr:23S rRNA (guanosine(2251)-2'-O)-methyltransferase RlmB [Flavobacterium sp.]